MYITPIQLNYVVLIHKIPPLISPDNFNLFEINMDNLDYKSISTRLLDIISKWKSRPDGKNDTHDLIHTPDLLHFLQKLIFSAVVQTLDLQLKQLYNLIVQCRNCRKSMDALLSDDEEFNIIQDPKTSSPIIMDVQLTRNHTNLQFLSPEILLNKALVQLNKYCATNILPTTINDINTLSPKLSPKLPYNILSILNILNNISIKILTPKIKDHIICPSSDDFSTYKVYNIESSSYSVKSEWYKDLLQIFKASDYSDIISGTLFHNLNVNRTCCANSTRTRMSRINILVNCGIHKSLYNANTLCVDNVYKNVAILYSCIKVTNQLSRKNLNNQNNRTMYKFIKRCNISIPYIDYNTIIDKWPHIKILVSDYNGVIYQSYKGNNCTTKTIIVYINDFNNGNHDIQEAYMMYY